MSNFNKVKNFMETFGQEVKTKPFFSTDKINSLRYDLIKEELENDLKELIWSVVYSSLIIKKDHFTQLDTSSLMIETKKIFLFN